VRIERLRRPHCGWTGSPRIDGVEGLSVLPKGDGVDVTLTLHDRHDAGVVLSAVLRMLQPTATGFPSLTWTAGVLADGLLAEQVRDVHEEGDIDAHVRRADVLLVPGTADATGVSPELAERVVPVREGEQLGQHLGQHWGEHEVRIDPTIHRPHGRASDAIGSL
jgi:hypothetical protein